MAVGIVVMVIALLPCGLAARADEIHVPADFPTIQEGIDAAVDGDEVIIADGVYTGDGNRNIDFLGKLIIVRSANGPENCIVDLEETANRGFLFVNGETDATILDGVTVRQADFQGDFDELLRGGAIFIDDASPTISNCIFFDNRLGSQFRSHGGAIYSSGNPRLTNCVFDRNEIWAANDQDVFGDDVSADGGAFYNDGGDPQFFDCHFQNNSTSSALFGFFGVAHGGAIGGVGSLTLTRCTFVDNQAASDDPAIGGAVKADGATLIDCHFEGNQAASCYWPEGGAIAITGESSLVLNCTFVDNVAQGGMPGEGGAMSGPGTLINCLFVDNSAIGLFYPDPARGGGFSGNGQIYNCTFVGNDVSPDGPGAAIAGDVFVFNTVAWNNIDGDPIDGATASYSNIEGGYLGEGNIDADPLFVDPDNGDYRLSVRSPSIDTGSNMVVVCLLEDLDGNERVADGAGGGRPVVDMGAYEFASPPAGVGADCNGNGLEDDCELAQGFASDCNGNGIPDNCDPDCNGNDIPDDCEQFDDCNGNGIPDECDADCNANGIPDDCEQFDDCNGNGIPDACDIADGSSEDCNGNGIPDECEQGDCNDNGIPDECEADCNRNGVPDDCDIAAGVSNDCNDNGIPDECDIGGFSSTSEMFSPVEDDVVHSFAMEAPPIATGDVTLAFIASADLEDDTERVDVELNGTPVGNVFKTGAELCPREPDSDQIDVPSSQFNEILKQFGFVELTMIPVGAEGCPGSYIQVTVSYDVDGDANGNGIPDECELLGDLDGDGDVDAADLIVLLGAWGSCDDCENCLADLDGDCDVDGADLILLLGNWG